MKPRLDVLTHRIGVLGHQVKIGQASSPTGHPGAEPIKNGEAVISIGGGPRTFHPLLAVDIPSARAILCMTRGLVTLERAQLATGADVPRADVPPGPGRAAKLTVFCDGRERADQAAEPRHAAPRGDRVAEHGRDQRPGAQCRPRAELVDGIFRQGGALCDEHLFFPFRARPLFDVAQICEVWPKGSYFFE